MGAEHPGTARTDDGRNDDLVVLKHRHLPVRESAEFVDWNRSTDELRPTPRFETVRPLVSFVGEYEQSLDD